MLDKPIADNAEAKTAKLFWLPANWHVALSVVEVSAQEDSIALFLFIVWSEEQNNSDGRGEDTVKISLSTQFSDTY